MRVVVHAHASAAAVIVAGKWTIQCAHLHSVIVNGLDVTPETADDMCDWFEGEVAQVSGLRNCGRGAEGGGW